ncbi:MAG: BRCT domain-containing protein [Ralstonia sp.]|uniref:BRCT domain-containing protein n=1 Tax=Ralstonia sp. TaxID=54061 RepID=UPI003F7EF279
MPSMTFVYRNQKGETKEYNLTNWSEVGYYIEGVCTRAHAVRTFRKDRVVEYQDGCDALLADPRPGPPPTVSKARETTNAPRELQILFTGFPAAQRTALEARATDAGLHVAKTVTQGLQFLCVGPNAGPAKVRKAREQSAYIVDQVQLIALLETGELPDDEPEWLY